MPQETTSEKLARVETLAERGLKPAAAQLSRLIIEREPNNVQALLWLARTTLQPDEAEKALDKAARLQPDDPEVQRMLGARQPQYAPPTNPYAPGYGTPTPSYAQPSSNVPSPYAPPPNSQPYGQAGYTPPPPSPAGFPGYAPPPPPPAAPVSSYDYLRTLSSATAQSIPPVQQPVVGPATTIKPIKKSSGLPGLLAGLIFLVAAIAFTAWWTLTVLDYNSDSSKPTSTLQGQVVELSSSKLVADIKGQSRRDFTVARDFTATLEPLVRDAKNNKSLAPNQVVLNVTPNGRLTSVEVVSPNKGTATNPGSGLLGFGPALDWGLVVLGLALALIGLLLVGRAARKTR